MKSLFEDDLVFIRFNIGWNPFSQEEKIGLSKKMMASQKVVSTPISSIAGPEHGVGDAFFAAATQVLAYRQRLRNLNLIRNYKIIQKSLDVSGRKR
ncbi:MAG: hypothetical protein AB1547_06300 [Thermodesulfobacteriota bacterium]